MIDQAKETKASYSSLCEKIQYGDACNGLEEDLKKFNDLWREMEIDFEKSFFKLDENNERNISFSNKLIYKNLNEYFFVLIFLFP